MQIARFVALCLALPAVPALAARVEVFPGPGALQAAIDGALDGDVLLIHAGTYSEAVTVTKRLRLRPASRDDVVTIDAACGATATVTIAAGGVQLKGLRIQGGSFFAVNAVDVDKIKLSFLLITETCGTAEYGVNVFQSDRLKIVRSQTVGGFNDAGIYIGGIPDGARVRVTRNDSLQNNRGIIVEDSTNSVVVAGNDVADSQTSGIFLHNSDGIVVRGNTVAGPGVTAAAGIELDGTSNGNRIVGNVISGATNDVLDNGAGNCWRRNTFTTGSLPPDNCS